MTRIIDTMAVVSFIMGVFTAGLREDWRLFAWVIVAVLWFLMYCAERRRDRTPVRYAIHLDPHGNLVNLDELARRIATIQREGFRADTKRGPR